MTDTACSTSATHDAIRRAILEKTERDCCSVKTARAALVRDGYYHADGTLTPEYGGAQRKTPV